MGRKIKKMEVDGQLAFEFLGQVCVEKKKPGATKDSLVNGKPEDPAAKEASGTQLELPF